LVLGAVVLQGLRCPKPAHRRNPTFTSAAAPADFTCLGACPRLRAAPALAAGPPAPELPRKAPPESEKT